MGWFDKIVQSVGKSISDISKNVFGIIPNEPIPIRTAQTRRVRQAPSAVRMGSPPRYEPVSLIVQMEQRIIDEQDERVALIQDPEIRRVATETVAQTAQQEQPIGEMIRPADRFNGTYRLTVQGKLNDGSIIFRTRNTTTPYKIGDEYDSVSIEDSWRNVIEWTVIEVKETRVIDGLNMLNRPVGSTEHSYLENRKIQDGGNCLINTIYEVVKTPTLTKSKLTDRILNEITIDKWEQLYNISKDEFKRRINENENVECSIETVQPYLEKYKKQMNVFVHTADKIDSVGYDIICVNTINYGETVKRTNNHNLIQIILTDNHTGLLTISDCRTKSITDKTNETDKPNEPYQYPVIIQPPKPKPLDSEIKLITSIQPIIETINQYILNHKSIDNTYMFNDDSTWGQFIEDTVKAVDPLRIGDKQFIVSKYYPINHRYGEFKIIGSFNRKSKMIIKIKSPYTLCMKNKVIISPQELNKMINYTNQLTTHVLNSQYNSTINLETFDWIVNNPRSCPRACIGVSTDIIYVQDISNKYQVNLDISKAYPSAIVKLSNTYIPKFSEDQVVLKYNEGDWYRQYDLILCEKLEIIGDRYDKMLDNIIIQNKFQFHYKKTLDKYENLTHRRPYTPIGVLRYSSIILYDKYNMIYNTYKNLINEDDKNLKLIGNSITGKMEKNKHIYKSKQFSTIESVSSYCTDMNISTDKIREYEIDMPSGIDHTFEIEKGISTIIENQLVPKMLIHSMINISLIETIIYINKNYKSAFLISIQTDGLTYYFNRTDTEMILNEYTKPNIPQFKTIGNMYSKGIHDTDEYPLNDILQRTSISKITDIEIPNIFEKYDNIIEIDEIRMKSDKEYFQSILSQTNILIIEGSGGTGKDYSINNLNKNVLNVCAMNSLSRALNKCTDDSIACTAHQFLSVGIDGSHSSKINPRKLEFDLINFSDAGLMPNNIQVIMIEYILDRQSKGLPTTLTLDKNQLSAITHNNSSLTNHHSPLDILYKHGTVITYTNQERIKGIENQQNLADILTQTNHGTCPYQMLSRYLPIMAEQEVVNTFNPDNDVIITPTNARREYFTNAITKKHFNNIPYVIGMKMVYIGQNDTELKLFKATQLVITNVSDIEITLNNLQEDTEVKIPIDKATSKLAHGFCKTIYSVQGTTIRNGVVFIDEPHHPLSGGGKSLSVSLTRNIDFLKNILIRSTKNYDWVMTRSLNDFIIDRKIEYSIEQVRHNLTVNKNCYFCNCKVFAPYFEKHSMDIIYSIRDTDNGLIPICKKCYFTEPQQTIVHRDIVYEKL